MIDRQPDITLEQAIQKTVAAGINLNFDKKQTVAGDFFQLQQEIKKTNSKVKTIWWIFTAIIVGAAAATTFMLADYFQFASKAYDQFSVKIEEQSIDHKTIESIKNDVELIKNNLGN
ncbi:MAG: hypothetical protein ABIE14_02760 [Patescibacteria group bacterium]